MPCPSDRWWPPRIAAAALLLFGGVALATDAGEPGAGGPAATLRAPVALNVALGRSAPDRFLVKVSYAAADAPSRARPPLNIALVIDRSGSMREGGKLEHALAAVRVVVENLTERDYVSIVAYNDRATVLSPSGRAVNRGFIAHRLEEVTAGGWTNLGAGLLEGIAQIASTSAEGQSRHVLLLSDGLANRGVTGAAGLKRIVEGARAQGIGVSTLGCGADFDGKLLLALADAGAGRFTYVRSPEQIPTAFIEELHGLLQVAAENLRLEVDAGPGAELTRVYGTVPGPPSSSRSVEIGTLRAGEHGVFVARLAAAGTNGSVEVRARLTFDDVATGRRAFIEAQDRMAQGARDRNDVALYGEVLEALDRAREAVAGYDEASAGAARSAFARAYEKARSYAIRSRDQELLNQTFLLKHFMDELDVFESEGWLHEHDDARRRFGNEADYHRYLLLHHRAAR